MLDALFPSTKQKVLILFFTHPDRSYHLREIIREVQAGKGAVERELRNLSETGILSKRKEHSNTIYTANRNCPIYDEIHNLIVKTAGVADIIRKHLEAESGIRYAFIFGSTASGTMDSLSDIDVLVTGDIDYSDITAALFRAEDQLDRHITPVVYSYEEFKQRFADRDNFLIKILTAPKIMLIGDEDGLDRMGAEQS